MAHQYDGVSVITAHRKRRAVNPSKRTPFPDNQTESKENLSMGVERNRFETLVSHNAESMIMTNNTQYNPSERKNPLEQYDQWWKFVLKIIYGILGTILLIAVILPAILVSLLVSDTSQTAVSQPQTISRYVNHCAGISPYPFWTINSTYTVTMKVNTSQCNFSETPLYFIAITGTAVHYCLTGYNAIYASTTDSFQIYAQYVCSMMSSSALWNLTQTRLYNVGWTGFYKEQFTYR